MVIICQSMSMRRIVFHLAIVAVFLGCGRQAPKRSSITETSDNDPSSLIPGATEHDKGESIVGLWNWEGDYTDAYHYVFRDDGTVSKYVITKAQQDGRWEIGDDGKLYVTLRGGQEKRIYQIECPSQIMDEGMEWTDDIDFPWTRVDAVRFPIGHRVDDFNWEPPRQITTP